jgi:hypothetical protein
VQGDASHFARFRAVVLGDAALQRRLKTITEWEPFTAEVVAAAHERDLELTADDIDAARRHELLDWLTRWA